MDNNGEASQLDIERLSEYSGRIIRPVGSIYKLSCKTVSEMNDAELADHIAKLKDEIHDTEQKLDQKRVLLTIANGQLAENETRRYRRLRNIHITPSGIRIVAGPGLSASFGKMIARWQANGRSNEEISGILDKLKELVERSNKNGANTKSS